VLKWRDFAKKVSDYFSGNQEAKKNPTAANQYGLGFRARVFFLNQFFFSDNETKKSQARIYAEEGGLAYQKAEAMTKAIQAADIYYQYYKRARQACNADSGLHLLRQKMDASIEVLVDCIVLHYPILLAVKTNLSADRKKVIEDRIRQEMQKYLSERVDFELDPLNIKKPYAVPYVSPETAYAAISSAHKMITARRVLRPRHRRTESLAVVPIPLAAVVDESAKVVLPTFSNTVGAWPLNPGYWASSLLNGASKFLFEYPARGICRAVNAMAGKSSQNSILANVIKTLLAGPFVVMRSLCFGVAKLLSPGGLKETWSICRNKSARNVADSSLLPPSRIVSVSSLVGRSVGLNILPGNIRRNSMPSDMRLSELLNNGNVLQAEPSSTNSIYYSIAAQQPQTPSKLLTPSHRAGLMVVVDEPCSPVLFEAEPSQSLRHHHSRARLAEHHFLMPEAGGTPKSARSLSPRFSHQHRRAASDNPLSSVLAPREAALAAISGQRSLQLFSVPASPPLESVMRSTDMPGMLESQLTIGGVASRVTSK
jgi:hypothetical protein